MHHLKIRPVERRYKGSKAAAENRHPYSASSRFIITKETMLRVGVTGLVLCVLLLEASAFAPSSLPTWSKRDARLTSRCSSPGKLTMALSKVTDITKAMVTALQAPVAARFRLPSRHEPDRAEDTRTEEHFLHQEKAIEFYRKQVLCAPTLCIVCYFILFSVIP
jgi:hypothetical protein